MFSLSKQQIVAACFYAFNIAIATITTWQLALTTSCRVCTFIFGIGHGDFLEVVTNTEIHNNGLPGKGEI